MAFKVCSHCQHKCGVRTLTCPECKNNFQKKLHKIESTGPLTHVISGKRRRRFKTVDWHDLRAGDKIRVIGGSGPYFIDEEGNRRSFTDRGFYRVVSLDKMGINAIGLGKLCGHQFLYMGPHVKSPLARNVYRRKHRFKKVVS